MTMRPVPDYFQQTTATALRSQARWLDDRLELDGSFLAKTLRLSESRILAWKNKTATLPSTKEKVFCELWRVVLHLMSHYNFEETLVKTLFRDSIRVQAASPLMPPWAGMSLQMFLEEHGAEAVREVHRWVLSLRFGDPYSHASTTRMVACL
jgi:hypothetical protein